VNSDELRQRFLDFFRERDHVIARSDLVVPSNDPTLLFTSAGMVQFKPYYTGEAPVPYRRAATSQKCLRAGGKANDLDEVGKTSRHMTFFEMLGNFSFGDYFKREAIEWAWEFTTQVVKFPAEQVWVTVFTEDDEAHAIWEKEIGIAPSRIHRLGVKDNFWGPAGDTGACGPCSELLFDRGEHLDPDATPEEDPHERFIEFWNLVFPQFDQQPDGSRPPLKNRGIDTGLGLERLAALIQKVDTVFDIDGVVQIVHATEHMASAKYAQNPVPFRVIADHIRALSFMIADGVLPSNEGRGYVERRLLRRAARFGREIGLEKPFLFQLVDVVGGLMGHHYPELREKQAQIEKIIHTEEERFASTLARGMDVLHEVFEDLEKQGSKLVPGEQLFKLHDTFGFPLDLATDIAEDHGYQVDRDGFHEAMAHQKERARGAWAGSGDDTLPAVYRHTSEEFGATAFIGYDRLEATATIQAIIKDKARVDALSVDEKGEIVLDGTPFYAEAGGQVGDKGTLEAAEGAAQVVTVKAPVGKTRLHRVMVTQGTLKVGDTVKAQVDTTARRATEAHHTATHLLQAALRDVLGEHVHQAGSLVAPEYLRFDFTHFEGIDRERLQDIERMVNAHIRANAPVTCEQMGLDAARAAGAMALFGEKYEDVVRVVKVDDISMELCGGCHVPATGVIGYFKILNESSIASGVRRIEAVCAEASAEAIQARERAAQDAAQMLKVSVMDLPQRVESLQDEIKKLQREVSKWKQAAATGGGADYMAQVQEMNGLKLLATEIDGQDAEGLRLLMDKLRDQIQSGVVVLGSASEGKVSLCVGVTKDLTGTVKAGDIVKQLAPIVGGGGGGRPDMAQAGGKLPEKLPEAIAKAPEVVREMMGDK
jgi:alanyl-tRNA synthetase